MVFCVMSNSSTRPSMCVIELSELPRRFELFDRVTLSSKEIPALTLRCADLGCYSRAGQGQVPVTLLMSCIGTGTTEWGRFESRRWRVEYKYIQAQRSQEGPRLLHRMGWPFVVECWVNCALL